VSHVSTGVVAARLNFTPPVCPETEAEFTQMLTKAGRIVSRLKTEDPDIGITALYERLNQDLSPHEKYDVRDELMRKMSQALKDGGIPPKITKCMARVFANESMQDIEIIVAKPSKSIILYLKCQSVRILLRLKEMVLSGLLLWLLNDAIKQFVESQHRIQLVIKAEDYNLSLFYLNSVTGTFVILIVYCYSIMVICCCVPD